MENKRVTVELSNEEFHDLSTAVSNLKFLMDLIEKGYDFESSEGKQIRVKAKACVERLDVMFFKKTKGK